MLLLLLNDANTLPRLHTLTTASMEINIDSLDFIYSLRLHWYVTALALAELLRLLLFELLLKLLCPPPLFFLFSLLSLYHAQVDLVIQLFFLWLFFFD